MAYLPPQQNLFSLLEEPERDDLSRLIRILEMVSDEKLIATLERERQGRRNEHPIRRMWYCMIASMLYAQGRINPLIAELHRNEGLRRVCHIPCVEAIPGRHVFKRFRQKLEKHAELLKAMFHGMLENLQKDLPTLGNIVACDSSGLMTHRRSSDPEEDGSYGKKRKVQVRADGSEEEILLEWFGFKLHLLVDAKTELPLAYRVTKASEADTKHLVPLVKELKRRHPEFPVEVAVADKGYDDGKNHEGLWEEKVEGEPLRVKGVIAKRNPSKLEEATLLYGQEKGEFDLKLGEAGGLCCYARIRERGQWGDRWLAMSPTGFEADRCTQKFRCPARHLGLHCAREKECNTDRAYGRVVRVPCETDWRRISPIQIGTPKWNRIYKERTSVERCFGRLKQVLGLGELAVWTKKRVEVQVNLAMILLVSSAKWHIEQGRQTHLNRLSAARIAA